MASARKRIPFVAQRLLGLLLPILAGLSVVLMVSVLSKSTAREPWVGAILGAVWALTAAAGSLSKSWTRTLRKLRPLDGGPSWNEALLCGTVSFVVVSILIGYSLTMGLAVLGASINFAYATLKLRCWLNRCCEGRRKNSAVLAIIKQTLGLQITEALLSLIFCAASLVGLIGGIYYLSICAGWMGHALVRWGDRYFRFPEKRLVSIFEWQSGGIIAAPALCLMIDLIVRSIRLG